MTNFTSPSPKHYSSSIRKESVVLPGVAYTIRRMSFQGRLELLRELRDLMTKAEFAAAGSSATDRVEAALLEGAIRKRQLEWGLVAIEGLEIDGEPATTARLLAMGPEELTTEIQASIQGQMGLSEEERKN
ncbi:MAG: hypothetical protein JNK87_20140 [Bryobacterales bacterium]|nr:hypothetical protein [Bryobacterales bacterium]